MIYIKRYASVLLMMLLMLGIPFTLQGDILGDIPTTQDIPILTGGVVPTAQLGSGSATSSTFLRGDSTWQVPATISDGDKGDITVSSTGTVWGIDNGTVSYAKMQDISSASVLLGRGDSGAGDPQEITLGSGLLMTGTTLSVTGSYTNEQAQDAIGLMIDSSLVYVDVTPLLTRAALTGDVTASQGSNALTIAADAVTYSKMQNVSAASKLLGRGDSGSGDVQEITIGTGLAMTGTTLSATASTSDPLVLVNRIAQSAGADQVTLWAADTDAVAGKSGLHLITEDGTQHVFGDKVGIGLISGMTSKLHVRGTDGGGATITLDAYNSAVNGSTFLGQHARGTAASPTYVALSDRGTTIQGNVWARNAANSADAWLPLGRMRFVVDSLDAQSRTGGRVEWYLSPGVSAAEVEVARIDQAGLLTVALNGTSALSTKLRGSTSGTLTHLPNATTTDHTLTWPAAQGAASTVLTNNGSGVLTWAAGGGGLSGGATDKVAIWSSSTTLTNDTNLHWDSTKNSLGIGTATFGTSLNNGIALTYDGSSFPSTNITDTVQLYAKDQLGTTNAGLFVKGETGGVTSLGSRLIVGNSGASLGSISEGGLQLDGSGPLIQLSYAANIAHGVTALVPTSIYSDFRNISNDGGLQIRSYSESENALYLSSITTSDQDTSKTTSSNAAVVFEFAKKAATSVGAMGAGVNLVRFTDAFSLGNRWILDNEGDTWQPGFSNVKHIGGLGTAPTVAIVTAGAGAAASATISGNDIAGTVTLTVSVSDTPSANSDIFTVTFNRAYATAPRIMVMPSNDAASNLAYGIVRCRQADVTTTIFKCRSGGVPLPPVTAGVYAFNYMIVE